MTLSLLDAVATLEPVPTDRLTLVESDYLSVDNLPSGQIGTVVEIYGVSDPVYLVEFADSQGREYAMAVLKASEILSIRWDLSRVA